MSSSIATDEELIKRLMGLVNHLVAIADEPQRWPLDRKEMAWFVRSTLAQAKEIRSSEPFLRGNLMEAFRGLNALTDPPGTIQSPRRRRRSAASKS